MWNNAWFITKNELKRSKWGKLVSVLLYLYFGIFAGFIVGAMYTQAGVELGGNLSFPGDIIFLTSMTCVGFSMTGDYMSCHKTDVFSRKLQYMRQLPIGSAELLTAKYLQMGITLVAQALLFFVPFYFISDFGDILTFAQFLVFAFVWICFGACVSVLFMHKELGGSGKSYFWFSVIVTGLLVVAALALRFADVSLVDMAVQAARSYGVWLIVIGVVFTILWTRMWFSLTDKKIRSRSFVR